MVTRTRADHIEVLQDVSWEAYERILEEHASQSAPRFTYDRGMLEVVSPLPNHERTIWALREIAQSVLEHREIEFENLGSTTFRRADLARGFEPDSCFYVTDIPTIRPGEPFDLWENPPPALVIEIDITHSSIDKLPLLAPFGVPEIWRYRNRIVEILRLDDGAYRQVPTSVVLSGVEAAVLSQFVAELEDGSRLAWIRRVRAWAAGLNA